MNTTSQYISNIDQLIFNSNLVLPSFSSFVQDENIIAQFVTTAESTVENQNNIDKGQVTLNNNTIIVTVRYRNILLQYTFARNNNILATLSQVKVKENKYISISQQYTYQNNIVLAQGIISFYINNQLTDNLILASEYNINTKEYKYQISKNDVVVKIYAQDSEISTSFGTTTFTDNYMEIKYSEIYVLLNMFNQIWAVNNDYVIMLDVAKNIKSVSIVKQKISSFTVKVNSSSGELMLTYQLDTMHNKFTNSYTVSNTGYYLYEQHIVLLDKLIRLICNVNYIIYEFNNTRVFTNYTGDIVNVQHKSNGKVTPVIFTPAVISTISQFIDYYPSLSL